MTNIWRNDPCFCGSGKKKKKCCESKQNDKNYILQHIEDYPVHQVFYSKSWWLIWLYEVMIIRKIPDTWKFIFWFFLCDIFMLGIKNCIVEISDDTQKPIRFLSNSQSHFLETEYQEAREIIIWSRQYAKNFGVEPNIDFEQWKYLIEYDKPCDISMKFGKNGKPTFIQWPHDNVKKLLEKFASMWLKEGKDFYYIPSDIESKFDGTCTVRT